MNPMKHVELLLFAACWWYLLLDGNIVTAFYSRNNMYPNSRDDDKTTNDVQHLISDTSEAVMLTAIIGESIRFVEMLGNNEKRSSDHREPGISRETSKPEFLNVIALSSMDRTGTWPGTFLSNFI